MFGVEHIELVALLQQDLGQCIEVNASCLWQNTHFVRSVLEVLHHEVEVNLARTLPIEQDRLRHPLHTILNQELVDVAIWTREEVIGGHFGQDEFNLELLGELIVLSELEDNLFEVMIGRNRRDNYIYLRYISSSVDEFTDEGIRGIPHGPLDRRHLKWLCSDPLLFEIPRKRRSKPSFATAWNSRNKDDRDQT